MIENAAQCRDFRTTQKIRGRYFILYASVNLMMIYAIHDLLSMTAALLLVVQAL